MNATNILKNTSVDLKQFDLSKLKLSQSKVGRPKLLSPEVEELIPQLIADGYSAVSIAETFGVSIWTIYRIQKRAKESLKA